MTWKPDPSRTRHYHLFPDRDHSQGGSIMMKGLAWYTGILMSLVTLYCWTIPPSSTNPFIGLLYAPPAVFAFKYLYDRRTRTAEYHEVK